jgi:hypothetical protein
MRTTIIYPKDGPKIIIPGGLRKYRQSYDAATDKPFHKRCLDAYYKLECEQKLRPTDIIKSKSYMRDIHQRALGE